MTKFQRIFLQNWDIKISGKNVQISLQEYLNWKNTGKKFIGKSGFCVRVRLNTFLILVIRIEMHVWVLFWLQIESPIRSKKDFTSANMFIKWNDLAMNFWQIFFPSLELLNSGCVLACVAGGIVFARVVLERAPKARENSACRITWLF